MISMCDLKLEKKRELFHCLCRTCKKDNVCSARLAVCTFCRNTVRNYCIDLASLSSIRTGSIAAAYMYFSEFFISVSSLYTTVRMC